MVELCTFGLIDIVWGNIWNFYFDWSAFLGWTDTIVFHTVVLSLLSPFGWVSF